MDQGGALLGATIVAQLVLGMLFIRAGIGKMRNVSAFAYAIDAFQLLPIKFTRVVARALPPIEIAIGIFLVVGFLARAAAAIAGMVLLMFSAVLIRGLLGPHRPTCNCFGRSGNSIDWWDVYRNAGLLILAAIIFSAPGVPLGLEAIATREVQLPPDPTAVIAAAVILAFAILLWFLVGEVGRRWKGVVLAGSRGRTSRRRRLGSSHR